MMMTYRSDLRVPPCFSARQWEEWRALARVALPSAGGFCEDCTPSYKLKMISCERCTHPEIEFDIIGAEIIGRRPKKKPATEPRPVQSTKSAEVRQENRRLYEAKRRKERSVKFRQAIEEAVSRSEEMRHGVNTCEFAKRMGMPENTARILLNRLVFEQKYHRTRDTYGKCTWFPNV